MSRILVLDDDPRVLRTLDIMLVGDGHTVLTANSGEDALELLARESVNIALVDLQLPGMNGIDVLRRLRDSHRDVYAVVITAHGSIETAVEATKAGAFDYLTKPFSPDQVRHRISQIQAFQALRQEVAGLRGNAEGPDAIITRHPALRHSLEIASEVAARETTILITGESGTGKNLLARAIHRWSLRRDGPFALVDCAALAESLLESELFGHVKGAFTGASADGTGKVETAHGGTLFLDEIGELPASLQAKLLRLVDARAYERIGDPTPRSIDARIIAATNRDLEASVAEGTFRSDLFYRLSVFEIHIPPLRQRPEDVSLLAEHFLSVFADRHAARGRRVGDETMALLVRYSWPGNARELSNVIERAVLVCQSDELRPEHLPDRIQRQSAAGASDASSILPLSAIEEEHIRKALALNLSLEETARMLGVAPSTLWRKRKRFGI